MLQAMITYTQIADARIIALFEQNETVSAKAISLFSHVLNAQHIWASRILGKAALYAVWEEHPISAFAAISKRNFEQLNSILVNEDLTKEIAYSNSRGEIFSNEVKDILFHVINHSTYHRAQIASLFKAESIQPPLTDYIMLKRESL